MAMQYAKAMGLQTIGIDSGDEKAALASKMGALVSSINPSHSPAC